MRSSKGKVTAPYIIRLLSVRWLTFIRMFGVLSILALVSSAEAQDGNLVWAKRAGGTVGDETFRIAVDNAGNSYVSGFFAGSMTVGQGELNQTVLTSAGADDIFVAKYNSNGTLQWAKGAGGTDIENGRDIAVDGSGNSYVTGFFGSSATFGLGEANQALLTSAGTTDIF